MVSLIVIVTLLTTMAFAIPALAQAQEGEAINSTGTASQIENLTTGNTPMIGNETDIQGMNKNDSSLQAGLSQEQASK
jgi:hypothetical protein